jgi:hypothetical protein
MIKAITFFSEEDERLTQDLVGVLSDGKYLNDFSKN